MSPDTPTLPAYARLPINRCNLPAVILGSLTFQRHPAPLRIDGVAELHADLFRELERQPDGGLRGELFGRYMAGQFSLDHPEEAGWERGKRRRADYQRMVRGWFFDPDNREAAVLKAWAESRFGLLTRHHRQPLNDPASDAYRRFQSERSEGLYNTNALEAQLDLLYAFGQYELRRRHPGRDHLSLYRGINGLAAHEVLQKLDKRRYRLLFNNLNSFSASRERASEFGDHLIEARIPLPKVAFYSSLLPGLLTGEEEYVVLGGVYEVEVGYF